MEAQGSIRLGHEGSYLRFEVPEGQMHEVTVTAALTDLVVSRRADAYGPLGSLFEFFASLAESWRGWDGSREWRSIEDDLRLSCFHDRKGHVVVQATLGRLPPQEWAEPGWSVMVSIVVDPGSLPEVASGLRRLLKVD